MAGKGGTGLLDAKTTADNKDKDKKKPTSRSSRAGIQFPVGRIHRHLKTRTAANGRVGATTAVYLAGNASKDLKVKGITSTSLSLRKQPKTDLKSFMSCSSTLQVFVNSTAFA
ncbi:histone H2A 11 [Euphorbia peplus]|nr:histone H2A 11 [Euphorbia peplus]